MSDSSYRNGPPLSSWRKNRAYVSAYVSVALVLGFIFLIYAPLPDRIDHHRDAVVSQIKNATIDSIHATTAHSGHRLSESAASLNMAGAKYAYATFLASDSAAVEGDRVLEHDKYFVATRILAYQLLHAPETKTTHDYPFIVLVTSDVSAAKRERLSKDGAVVWEAPPMDVGWVKTDISTWQNVMSKLRLWQLTEFERICFLDGDTILAGSMDEVFEDPAAAMQQPGSDPEASEADEAALPLTYVFAGVPEPKPKHNFPPSEKGGDYHNINYLNAGFFVLQPSNALLNYYTRLTTLPDRFDPHLPEQNLLNYAHRRDGNMPWKQLSTKWNVHYPTRNDLDGGVRSLHEKWRAPVNRDMAPLLLSWRWRMEGFYEARDALRQ
ncbi:hypothetical protein B0A50_01797 [Salinomyces thailandicus]|uniref:Uncharacterized protein n=1 Tax=Salinomyces thailandicus TaxID=706561 RepID=A0A4V5N664_9PEZI|nr:hypothetical protein B0A50_01797 [Salinomyces thailandica]